MGGACNTYGGEERCIQDLGGELEGKRSLGKPRHRREGDIMMDLQEVGWGVQDKIDLDQDRNRWQAPANAVKNFWGPMWGIS
jgi:hypothetical protein